MATLTDRLTELMDAMSWEHSDVVRISQQSSSVVSQWLGKGSKQIKTIGKMEAAIYLERASGYSALWIAKGLGPKRPTSPPPRPVASRPHLVGEVAPPLYTAADVLGRMASLLASVPARNRSAVADVLRGWALDAGADDRIPALLALIAPLEKRVA